MPNSSGLLNSWKEISAYLGRGVRTVQRWEKEGLPVRRIGSGNRAPVLAYAHEIDFWIHARAETMASTRHHNLVPDTDALHQSIDQARILRGRMIELRRNQLDSLEQLIATVISMEKSFGANLADPNVNLIPQLIEGPEALSAVGVQKVALAGGNVA